METETLTVLPMCTSPNFGLKIERDSQYNRAYILDIADKSSTAKLFSSLKASCKAIRLLYIEEIAGHCIFTKSEATTAISKLSNEGVSQFHIAFAVKLAPNAR